MARRGVKVQEKPTHPLCGLCRDGTYANLSLQMFDQVNCPWSSYCDTCGKAMLSVLKDAQGRIVVTKPLPPPPAKTAPPATTKPARSAVMAALADVDNTPQPAHPPKKLAPPPDRPGYDLLAMLGMPKR